MTNEQQKQLQSLFDTEVDGKKLSHREAADYIASVNNGIAPSHTSIGRALKGEGHEYVVSCYINHLRSALNNLEQ